MNYITINNQQCLKLIFVQPQLIICNSILHLPCETNALKPENTFFIIPMVPDLPYKYNEITYIE